MRERQREYLELLRRELVPALGCTEPIAIAYGTALARRLLGSFPERMTVSCSGNIIKNVKGVVVPTTGDLRGIDTSALLGALAGDPDLEMEVLSRVGPEDVEQVRALRQTGLCQVKALSGPACLHIIVEAEGNGHTALVEILDGHTNVVLEQRDGVPVFQGERAGVRRANARRQEMTVADIYEFARTVPLEELEAVLRRQVECNLTIAEEGLQGEYGVRVGKTLLAGGDGSARRKAIAYAAAMTRAAGCGLERLFEDYLKGEGGSYELAVDFSFYEEGGYAATIRGEAVLLGTASFMRKMDIRLPGNLNLKTGIYLAIEHHLSAVFAIKYEPSENVDFALKMMRRSHLLPILASRDPNITPALLRRKFSKNIRLEYPDLTDRVALSEAENDHGDLPRALVFREGLLPYAEEIGRAHV